MLFTTEQFLAVFGQYNLASWPAQVVAYAMVVYPVMGSLLSHGYPQSAVFGVASCPLTIFTFGAILWTRDDARIPGFVAVIPFLWSPVGSWAAGALGIREDAGLPIAGGLGTALLVRRDGHILHRRQDFRLRLA